MKKEDLFNSVVSFLAPQKSAIYKRICLVFEVILLLGRKGEIMKVIFHDTRGLRQEKR